MLLNQNRANTKTNYLQSPKDHVPCVGIFKNLFRKIINIVQFFQSIHLPRENLV